MAYNAFENDHGQEALFKSPATEVNVSLPNSQQSSLNETSSSQPSRTHACSSDVYESSKGIMTPSTTLSNKSSEERVTIDSMNEADVEILGPKSGIGGGQCSLNPQPASFSGYLTGHTSAPKRTASGEVKSSVYSLPTSPVDESHYRHSRNSSMTSRDSQIGELSTHMKTRLAYAKFKVQRGWQSHNISELEHLMSNQGSPISAGPDQQRQPACPIVNGPTADYSPIMQLSERTSGMLEHDDASPTRSTPYATNGDYQQRVTNYQLPTSQVGASYESFWREHEGSAEANATRARNPSVGGPSLAPPVDILPRNPRRLDSSIRQPPILRTNNLHSSNDSLDPRTPSPKKPSSMRTPSQQAAFEKDAVETLLFMSSPGNSDYRPHTAPSGTPLRSEYLPHASHSVSDSTFGSIEAQSHSIQPRCTLPAAQRQTVLQTRRPLSDTAINAILDEMPDTSSSDDDNPQARSPDR